MNTVVVWLLLTISNTEGITSEKPSVIFPTQQECEKVRLAELSLVKQMQSATWGSSSNTGRYIQNKCEQATILVIKQ